MSLNNLFYTEKATLLYDVQTKPNVYGIVTVTGYEVLANDIPCCITPIHNTHVREKYGVETQVSFEVALDYVKNCEHAKFIGYGDVMYRVKTYVVHPAFMCLPKSITFIVEKM